MSTSSTYVAPSAIVLLSSALLLGLSSTALSQINAGPAQLPSVTVDAPKQAAKPQRPVATPQRAVRATNTAVSRGTSPTTGQTTSYAPGSTMGQLARLERSASSCNGGCETSFKTANAPWVGCSYSAGIYGSVFSATCTDTLSYKTYAECLATKQFLGAIPREARFICSGLYAGGKLAGERPGRRT